MRSESSSQRTRQKQARLGHHFDINKRKKKLGGRGQRGQVPEDPSALTPAHAASRAPPPPRRPSLMGSGCPGVSHRHRREDGGRIHPEWAPEGKGKHRQSTVHTAPSHTLLRSRLTALGQRGLSPRRWRGEVHARSHRPCARQSWSSDIPPAPSPAMDPATCP